jgi:hypothetical protein
LAKSILTDAGIPSLAKGEGVQDLFGLGRAGTGYSVLAGPVELCVTRDDEIDALALLSEIRDGSSSAEHRSDEYDSPFGSSPGFLCAIRSAWWRKLVWLSPVFAMLAWFLVSALGNRGPRPPVRSGPALPFTRFGAEVGSAVYGHIRESEGGYPERFPVVVSIRVVVLGDSVLLEEWAIERPEQVVYYPVFAFPEADGGWHVWIGDVQDTMVTESSVPGLRDKIRHMTLPPQG